MLQTSLNKKVHYTLLIAVAMCFIGHGAFGIVTKPIWCNYFAVFGIGKTDAYTMMPIVGAFDILLGVIILLYPMRLIPAWLVFWGLITASLRPLSGEPFAELIERAGNFGAPLALLILSGVPKNIKGWFTAIDSNTEVDNNTLKRLATCLKVIAFLLFVGHGWLNLIEKKGLINQYTSLGFSNPENVAQIVGLFEIAAAFLVLIKPVRAVVFGLFIWKMLSEVLYPQYELFEWVERGGSYGVLLALWFIAEKKSIVAWPKIRFLVRE